MFIHKQHISGIAGNNLALLMKSSYKEKLVVGIRVYELFEPFD